MYDEILKRYMSVSASFAAGKMARQL